MHPAGCEEIPDCHIHEVGFNFTTDFTDVKAKTGFSMNNWIAKDGEGCTEDEKLFTDT